MQPISTYPNTRAGKLSTVASIANLISPPILKTYASPECMTEALRTKEKIANSSIDNRMGYPRRVLPDLVDFEAVGAAALAWLAAVGAL